MGINSDWSRIWASEGREYVTENVDAETVFIDGQIMLMQSQVPRCGMSWGDFVQMNFARKLVFFASKFKTVVVAFDNYESVPAYKKITQARRSAQAAEPFVFGVDDTIGDGPPAPKTWQSALLNRVYKTHVISRISSILAHTYKPAIGKEFILDFVNCVRIKNVNGQRTQEVLPDFVPMGESDVKFMRYANEYGNLLVDSIDSDVLLIAFMYLERHEFQHKLYIRRYAVQDDEEPSAKSSKIAKQGSRRRYEIIDATDLLLNLHLSVQQAVGKEMPIETSKLTKIITFVSLLAGSDFSRKLPLVGAKYLWESLPSYLPLLVQVTSQNENNSGFELDSKIVVDVVLSEMYRLKFENHTKHTSGANYLEVFDALQSSKLSSRTRAQLMTLEQVQCTIDNIRWIMGYWEQENGVPQCDNDGAHGFLIRNGVVSFSK